MKIPPVPAINTVKDAEQLLRSWERFFNQQLLHQFVYQSNNSLAASDEQSGTRIRMDCTSAPLTYTVYSNLPVGWKVDVAKIDSTINALVISGSGCTFNDPATGTVASLTAPSQFDSYSLLHIGGGVFDVT